MVKTNAICSFCISEKTIGHNKQVGIQVAVAAILLLGGLFFLFDSYQVFSSHQIMPLHPGDLEAIGYTLAICGFLLFVGTFASLECMAKFSPEAKETLHEVKQMKAQTEHLRQQNEVNATFLGEDLSLMQATNELGQVAEEKRMDRANQLINFLFKMQEKWGNRPDAPERLRSSAQSLGIAMGNHLPYANERMTQPSELGDVIIDAWRKGAACAAQIKQNTERVQARVEFNKLSNTLDAVIFAQKRGINLKSVPVMIRTYQRRVERYSDLLDASAQERVGTKKRLAALLKLKYPDVSQDLPVLGEEARAASPVLQELYEAWREETPLTRYDVSKLKFELATQIEVMAQEKVAALVQKCVRLVEDPRLEEEKREYFVREMACGLARRYAADQELPGFEEKDSSPTHRAIYEAWKEIVENPSNQKNLSSELAAKIWSMSVTLHTSTCTMGLDESLLGMSGGAPTLNELVGRYVEYVEATAHLGIEEGETEKMLSELASALKKVHPNGDSPPPILKHRETIPALQTLYDAWLKQVNQG